MNLWPIIGLLVGALLTQVPDVTLNFGQPVPSELVPVHYFPCEPTLYDDIPKWMSYPSITFLIGPIDTLRMTFYDGPENYTACTLYLPRSSITAGGVPEY